MKLMLQNEFKKAKDLDVVRANSGDKYVINIPQGMQGRQY